MALKHGIANNGKDCLLLKKKNETCGCIKIFGCRNWDIQCKYTPDDTYEHCENYVSSKANELEEQLVRAEETMTKMRCEIREASPDAAKRIVKEYEQYFKDKGGSDEDQADNN